MGCDIHICVEYRDKNKWKNVGKIFIDKYPEDPKDTHTDFWYIGRCYELFTVLAGVRGCWGELPLISQPRNYPENVSKSVKKHIDNTLNIMGYHNWSWLTIKELLDYRKKYAKILKNKAYNDSCERYFFYTQLNELIQILSLKLNILPSTVGYDNVRLVFWFDC